MDDERPDVIFPRALPFEPLVFYMPIPATNDGSPQRPSAALLAARVGVNVGTIHRWRRHGVPLSSADRVAIALGSHVHAIWHDHLRLEDLPCAS